MARSEVSFLRGREVWPKVTELVRKAKRTHAAIAYFGRNAAALLPLKPGDTLVVDMSRQAVRQGVTDPFELEPLLAKGVRVASRGHLHAKLIVADEWLVVGSMNVSRNSENVLDEAAMVTNSPSAVRQALATIRLWANEPVLDNQLEEAKKEYVAPKFKAAVLPRAQRANSGRSVRRARLWIIGGLEAGAVPESEAERAKKAERAALVGYQRRPRTTIEHIHHGERPGYFAAIRRGDWVIPIVEGRVQAPARVVRPTSYRRGKGKRRWLLVVEERDVPDTSAAAFRRAVERATGWKLRRLQTRAISDDAHADAILGCWSPSSGKPRKRYFQK